MKRIIIFLVLLSGVFPVMQSWNPYPDLGSREAPQSGSSHALGKIGLDIADCIWHGDEKNIDNYTYIIPFPDKRRISMLHVHPRDTVYACIWGNRGCVNCTNYVFWSSCDTVSLFSGETSGGTGRNWPFEDINEILPVATMILNHKQFKNTRYREWRGKLLAAQVVIDNDNFKVLQEVTITDTTSIPRTDCHPGRASYYDF